MSRCDNCVTDRSFCDQCADNPKYPKYSYYQDYIPTCPRGYTDCVFDPAYIKCYHPEWYAKLYGNMTPEEASKEACVKRVEEDPDEIYSCYDDEDK